MATRAVRALRGFLVHDSRIDLDHLAPNTGTATSSSYTHADPQPGSPVAADPKSTLLPHVHHAQAADLELVTTRAGVPRRGALPGVEGAALAYRVAGEGNVEYRGWNEPNLVTGYRPVEWSTSSITWEDVTAVTIPSTQEVVAVGFRSGIVPQAWTRSPTSRTWSANVDVTGGTYDYGCCLLLSRIERVLVLAVDGGVIDAHYSDDAGLSWAPYATQVASGLATFADSLQAIEDRNGNILMVLVDNATGEYEQWVSSDGGATFNLQDTATGWAIQHRLARLADGRILVAYVVDSADNEVAVIVLEDAFDSISNHIIGVQLDGTTTVDSIAACVDADGAAYVYAQREAFTVDSAQAKLFRSITDAATWEIYETPSIYTARGGGLTGVHQDLTHHLLAVAATGGEIVVLATPEYEPASSPPTTDGSLVAITLGGWCSDEQPGLPFFGRLARGSWGPGATPGSDGSVWLPTQTLAYQNWDDTASGGPLEVDPVPAGYHRFSAVADQSWAEYGDNAFETEATFIGEIAVNGGTTGTADHGRLRIARCDGVNEAGVRIGATSEDFRVRDYATNVLLAPAVPLDMVDDVVQFMVVFRDLDQAAVYYKLTSSSVWILVVEAALTTQASVNIGNSIRVGTPATAVTSVVTIGMVALLYGPAASEAGRFMRGLNNTTFHPRLRWGKPLGPQPYPLRDQVAEYSNSPMTFISASGGACREGETFTAAARRDYDVRNLLPQLSPSPARPWRSAGSVEQVLTWDLGQDTRLGHSWALGLALLRTNFRTATLEVRTDGGTSTTLGTWDAIAATSVGFIRGGDLVEPAAGPSAPAFWRAQSLAGGFVIFDPAGSPVARRILGHQGGGWGPGPGVRPALRIELLGGEPASGVMHVIAPSAVLVVHQSAPTPYRYVRIRIPVQTTVSANREIGQVILGGLLIPGRQWSRGWSWRYTPNTRVEVDDYGTQWTDNRGPVARELTVSHQDGLDLSAIRRGTEPPYLSASGGTPGLAAADDVWFQLAALLEETEGASLPVVAMPEVPPVTGMLLGRDQLLYGLLKGRVQANNVQGDEGRDEVVRVESVTVMEQV